MRTAARLTFRLYRFELLAILGYGLLLAGVALVVAVRLNAVSPGPDCLRTWISQGAVVGPGCADPEAFFTRNEAEAGKVMAAMWLLPLVAGVLAGSVLVAREIEHRTAQFAWSVGPSRRRWFLDRLLPVLVVAVGAVVLASVTAEVLEAARMPWINGIASAHDYGLRGPIPVALAFAAFGVSVLVGSVVGRMLPALLVAAVLVVGMRSQVEGLMPFGEPIVALDPAAVYYTTDWPLLAGTGDAPIGVRAADVWHVELRESAVLVAIGAVSLIGAGLVVSRRRPY